MRNSILVLLLILFSASEINAQCSGRYFDKLFSTTQDNNVNFGSAIDMNGSPQQLDMHVFEPSGDTEPARPLIIFAFGGSFTAGFKESPDILTLCQEFAERGYVTATIDYRLNTGTVDSAAMLQAVVRAVQDVKACVRYFYKDARTTNTYRVDTNHIFMGGTSAGAFIGIHMAYIPDIIGLSTWMKEIIESVGDLEGSSGNPGYPSRIHGVINLAGAIGDTSWIDPGEPPMVSMHGDEDGTVPYCSEIINVSGSDIIVVDGSGTLKKRMANLGIYNPFYTWRGADHVPYVNPLPPPFSDGPLYMDTTVRFVRDFLFKLMTGNECGQALADIGRVTNPCGSEIIESVSPSTFPQIGELSIYPNPSEAVVEVAWPGVWRDGATLSVFNPIGQLVFQKENLVDNHEVLNKSVLGKGLFFVEVEMEKTHQLFLGKVVFQ